MFDRICNLQESSCLDKDFVLLYCSESLDLVHFIGGADPNISTELIDLVLKITQELGAK